MKPRFFSALEHFFTSPNPRVLEHLVIHEMWAQDFSEMIKILHVKPYKLKKTLKFFEDYGIVSRENGKYTINQSSELMPTLRKLVTSVGIFNGLCAAQLELEV